MARTPDRDRRARAASFCTRPTGSFLGGRTDNHRDSEVRSVLAPVAKLAEIHGPAVLVVAHRRKSVVGSADDQALGSRAFTGIARAVWHLTRDRQDKSRRLLLPGKNNLAVEGGGLAFTIAPNAEGRPAIQWDPAPIAMTADDALREENAEPADAGVEAGDEIAQWLHEFLAHGPVSAREVRTEAANLGYAWRTVQRVAARSGVQFLRDYAAHRCTWRLAASADPVGTPT